MKTLVITVCLYIFFGIHVIACAQQENTSSIQVAKNHFDLTKEKRKADSLLKIEKPTEALRIYEQVFNHSISEENQDFYIETGLQYYQALLVSESFKSWRKRSEILDRLYKSCEENKNQKCLGRILLKFAKHYEYRNKVTSLQYSKQSEKVLLAIKDSFTLVNLYNLNALIYRSNMEYEKSSAELIKALNFVTDQNNGSQISRTYARLLREMLVLELLPENWVSYYEDGARICNEGKGQKEICTLVFINGAYLHARAGNPKKASEIIFSNINFDSIKKFKSSFKFTFPYFAEYVAGYAYQKLGEDKKAITHLLESKAYCIKKKDTSLHLLVSESLTDIYLKQRKFNLATIEMNNKRKMTLMQNRKNRSNRLKLDDIIANLNKEEKIKVQENEIKNLSSTNFNISKSNTVLQSALFLGVIIFLIIISIILYRLNTNKIRLLEYKQEASLNKLKLLQSAMNPHFLFNTFGTLQHYILSKDSFKANDYMTELSGLIRNIFYTSDKTFIKLSKELEILKSYIVLEQGRFKIPFTINYEIAPDLQIENPLIPPMIIQPYIENSIKHGFEQKDEKYTLTLVFKKEHPNQVVCEVIDDGIGRNASAAIQKTKSIKRKHLSIASKSTEERLDLMEKIEGLYSSIDIVDLYDISGKTSGTKVTIVLPVKKENT